MSTAPRSPRIWRNPGPAGQPHGSLLVSLTPELPGVAEAVACCIDQTPDLQGRPVAWQTTDEQFGAGGAIL